LTPLGKRTTINCKPGLRDGGREKGRNSRFGGGFAWTVRNRNEKKRLEGGIFKEERGVMVDVKKKKKKKKNSVVNSQEVRK